MSINKYQIFFLYLLMVVCTIGLVLSKDIIILNIESTIKYLGIIVSFFWVISIYIFFSNNLNQSLSNIYVNFFIILGLFHLGIPIGNFFNYGNEYLDKNISRWYTDIYTIKSLTLVYIFFIGYISSVLLNFRKTRLAINNSSKFNNNEAKIAFNFFVFLVSFWIVYVVFINQIRNYTLYAIGNNSSPILSFLFTFGNNAIGILFVLLCLNKIYAKKTTYIFGIWALFALPIGLRGEVLFPFMIALALLIRYQIIYVSWMRLFLAVGTVLTILSTIFVYRHGEKIEGTDINPLAAIIEMGGSLRPVNLSIYWIDTKQVTFYLGETYSAPFERMITKFIPFLPRLPASEDMRLMNTLISSKAGPYGFSLIAESYINFSTLGVLFSGVILGVFFKNFDLKNSENAIYLILIFAVFFHVRQSFLGATSVFLIGIGIYISIKLISKLLIRY